MDDLKDLAGSWRRIVVKMGTSTLSKPSGVIDKQQIENITSQAGTLFQSGKELVLVSSGAIAAGIETLGWDSRPKDMSGLQAAASVGQSLLMSQWRHYFEKQNIPVGQILLTQEDFTHREHYLNARNVLERLLGLRIIPILNENDAIAVEEIRFGENDILCALTASLINADLLIILSDTPGVYCQVEGEKQYCGIVKEITPELEAQAGAAGSRFGSGGMITKLAAAKIANQSGVHTIIADGREPGVLTGICSGELRGSFFVGRQNKVKGRKSWIAFGRLTKGTITIDEGAKQALIAKGKSLLAAGITDCRGDFYIGDTVEVADNNGQIVARGLSNYNSDEIKKIKGKRSEEILNLLGEEFAEEVIHRDCLVIL